MSNLNVERLGVDGVDTDGHDPGDEHHETPIPIRCPTCDRYCGGRCPTAIHKEKS